MPYARLLEAKHAPFTLWHAIREQDGPHVITACGLFLSHFLVSPHVQSDQDYCATLVCRKGRTFWPDPSLT